MNASVQNVRKKTLVEEAVDAGSGNCREVAQFEAEEESSRHLFPFMLMLEVIFSA